MIVGLISDTHGLLRDAALNALTGSAHIIHAGDIGKPRVLEDLRAIAPLSAIRGNVDREPWADAYPHTLDLQLGGAKIHVAHDRKQLNINAEASGIDVVVTGHSHKPLIERVGAVTYVNPGSAGPRRFRLPIAVALLELHSDNITARIVELPP